MRCSRRARQATTLTSTAPSCWRSPRADAPAISGCLRGQTSISSAGPSGVFADQESGAALRAGCRRRSGGSKDPFRSRSDPNGLVVPIDVRDLVDNLVSRVDGTFYIPRTEQFEMYSDRSPIQGLAHLVCRMLTVAPPTLRTMPAWPLSSAVLHARSQSECEQIRDKEAALGGFVHEACRDGARALGIPLGARMGSP